MRIISTSCARLKNWMHQRPRAQDRKQLWISGLKWLEFGRTGKIQGAKKRRMTQNDGQKSRSYPIANIYDPKWNLTVVKLGDQLDAI
jgi:hypothetical protein